MTIAPATAAATLSRYLGVSESPAGSNCQQFSHRVGRGCEAWCDDFQSCVFWLDLGFDFTSIGLPISGTAACSVHCGACKRAGTFSFTPREHAWVFFGPSGSSHIEYVVALVRNAAGVAVGIDTIGGNTSAPNNYAGGTVAAHRRMFGPGDDIYGYGYLPLPSPTPPEEEEMRPFVIKTPSNATAYLVGGINPVTGKYVALEMADANDLRNPPDGYGPIVEVSEAAMANHVER